MTDKEYNNTPNYIVVEGPIGVGKTSLVQKLAASLNGQTLLEAPEENPFLEKFYKTPNASALPTQLFFLMQRAQQIENFHQSDLFGSVRIADFLIEKDRLFAELTLDADELKLYEQMYAHMTMDAPTPDLVVYLQASPKILKERIAKRGIAMEQKISGDYLDRLSEAYMRFFHAYTSAPLLIVNAEDLNYVHNQSDYTLLLEQIKQPMAGRQYFNPQNIPI